MKRQITKTGGGNLKGVEPPKSSEREFSKAMEYMVDFMTRFIRNNVINELNQTTIDKFADAKQTGNYANVFLTLNKKAQRKLLKRFDDKKLEKITRKILGKVNRRNAQQFYSSVEDSIGTNAKELLNSEGLQSNINALMLETAQWAKKLRDETLEAYTANTLRVMAQGGSLTDVLAQYSGMEEKRKNHAKMVSRTQIANFNSLVSKARAENLGIEKAVWVTSRDERVRRCHAVRDKKEFDLNKGLYSSCDNKTLLPGTDFNCFEGSAKINHTSRCLKVFRRFFSGKLTELVFDDGVIYRSTPNHPVFTVNGFKGAGLIDIGEYVVGTRDKSLNGVNLNGDDMIPTFEEVFSALDLLGVERGVSPAINGKFHGDISDSEIDVICLDGLLMSKVDTTILKKFNKLNLSNADKMIVFKFFTCSSKLFSFRDTLNPSSACVMRVFNLVRSSFLIHLSPLELFRFALGSWCNASSDQSISYDVSGHPEVFSDSVFAYSVLVHGLDAFDVKFDHRKLFSGRSDTNLFKLPVEGGLFNSELLSNDVDSESGLYQARRVIEKRSIDFHGFVYNLETISNDYISNATAVSNCRCTYTFVIPED